MSDPYKTNIEELDDESSPIASQIPSNQSNNNNDFNLHYDEGEFGEYVDVPVSSKLRGRKAMNDVFKLVSSKLSRDIVRKNQYMPGQFAIWNAKKSGGNNKYYGGYEDYDKDGLPIEYVVRRGDKDGPIIVVNGYTTTKSDWAAKNMFYNKYPSREERKGKNVKTFMRDEYYVPVYADNGMDVASYTKDPKTDEMTKKLKEKYNLHIVKERSPYRAIGNELVFPVIKQLFLTLGNGNEKKAKLYRKVVVNETGMKAFETEILASIYDENVKDRVLTYIANAGKMDYLKQSFETLRQQRKGENYRVDWNNPNSETYKDFEHWLFAKKAVKDIIKSYITPMLTTKRSEYQSKINNLVKNYIYSAVPDIDAKVKELYKRYVDVKSDKLTKLLDDE